MCPRFRQNHTLYRLDHIAHQQAYGLFTLKDGSTLECLRDYPRGDPGDPLSDEEIEEKALSYLTDLTGGKRAKTIISRIWDLEREQSLDWLVDPLKQRIIKEN